MEEEIKDLIKSLESVFESSRSSKTWTYKLNSKFIEYAHKKGFYVYSKTKGSDWGEWLYDLTICKQKEDIITDTFLVLESEWKSDDESILVDFQKLLLCNADFKVMVYWNNPDIKDDLLRRIKNYHKANGVFILACVNSDKNVTFEIYITYSRVK